MEGGLGAILRSFRGGGTAEVVQGRDDKLAGLKIWWNCSNLLAADLFLVHFEVFFVFLVHFEVFFVLVICLTKQGGVGVGWSLLPVDLPTDSFTKQGRGGVGPPLLWKQFVISSSVKSIKLFVWFDWGAFLPVVVGAELSRSLLVIFLAPPQ